MTSTKRARKIQTELYIHLMNVIELQEEDLTTEEKNYLYNFLIETGAKGLERGAIYEKRNN